MTIGNSFILLCLLRGELYVYHGDLTYSTSPSSTELRAPRRVPTMPPSRFRQKVRGNGELDEKVESLRAG